MSLDESSVTRVVLPNGLTVLIQTDHTAPVAAIVTCVKAGYFDESDDENGISHVLEHMYFKGTPTRGVGEIAKQTKAAGGQLNAHTIYDDTVYYAVLPSAALEAGLRIQADAFANSLIDPAELAKELEVIIEEAKRKTDNPSAVARETLFELLHDEHRIRRWRIGREPGLRALTSADLRSFYKRFYRPSNTILSISGDVDAHATMRLVESLYGSLPAGGIERDRGPSEPDHTGFRYRELSGDVGQSQLVLGWRTAGALHPDTPRLDFAASLLSAGRASRLYRSVRERRLATYVSAANQTPTDIGVFVIQAEADPDTSRAAMAAIWSEVKRLGEGRIGDSEMERVRTMFDAQWLRRLETAEGRANFLAEWEALGGWQLGEEYRQSFLSCTAVEVSRAVAKYLSPDRAAALVYRPESAPVVARDANDTLRILNEAVLPLDDPPAAPAILTRSAVHAELEREENGVSAFRSRKGVPILVQRMPGASIAHLSAHSLGGAITDGADRAGLTMLAARTMLKGTSRLSADDIAQSTESLGATLGSALRTDSFGWGISVPIASFSKAASLFGDVILNPAFPEQAFETERRAALSNLALLRDDMMRYPLRMLTALAFEGHPYGSPVTGTEDSLANISVADARSWHERNVLTSPMAIGVVADMEPAVPAGIIAAELDGISEATVPEVAPPSWTRTPRSVSESRDKAQTALALAFPGPARGEDSRWAAHLLGVVASGLGGRFFEELRDRRSLAYTVSLSARDMRLAGMFVAYIATSPEKEDEARSALLSEFDRLRQTPVTGEELTRAKDYVLGAHAIARESGAERLGEMLDAWLFGSGLAEIAEYEARVRAISAEQIRALAERYFDPAKLVEAVVRGGPRAG